MAKGIKIVEGTPIEKIMDKNYYVDGIEEIISKDDQGSPIFKLTNGSVEPKIWVKLRSMPDNAGNREEGPAMSLLPAEFVALVHAFGATDYTPTKENRMLAPTIMEGVEKANSAAEAMTVESKDGWASVFQLALHPPEGKYTVRFKEAFSPRNRDTLDFSEGANDSRYIILKFEIVADGQGDSTVWEGFVISNFMYNAFVDYHDNGEEVLNAMELGHPVIAPGKSGERWFEFGKYFVPGVWDNYDWQVNPTDSRYGVCEVKKPQFVLINRAAKEGHAVKVWYEKKERNNDYWFDMLTLKQHNESPKVLVTRSATPQEFVDFVNSRDYWENFGPDDELFLSTDPIDFTEAGKVWAKNYLAAPWTSAGLDIENRSFEILSPEQLGRLMNEMEALYK